MNDLTTLGSSAKDFLTREEKRIGAIATALLLGVGTWGLYNALPFINSFLGLAISAVGRLIVLGGLGVVAVILVTLFMQERTWTEIWHMQRRFTAWVSSLAMKADPFGRMRAFANEYLDSKWQKFNGAATTIEDQLIQKRQKIEKFKADLEEWNTNVETLKNRHFTNGAWDTEVNRNNFRLLSQKITFTENSVQKLEKDEIKLQLLVKIIDKWRNNFRFEIETTRMTADFLEEDFRQADATAGAVEAASSAFGGGDMAQADKDVRQYIEKLTSGRMARAEVLMKQIPELTAIGDLKGDAAEDEIMRRLKDLDSAADEAFREGQEERYVLTTTTEPAPARLTQVINTPAKEKVTRRYLK